MAEKKKQKEKKKITERRKDSPEETQKKTSRSGNHASHCWGHSGTGTRSTAKRENLFASKLVIRVRSSGECVAWLLPDPDYLTVGVFQFWNYLHNHGHLWYCFQACACLTWVAAQVSYEHSAGTAPTSWQGYIVTMEKP